MGEVNVLLAPCSLVAFGGFLRSRYLAPNKLFRFTLTYYYAVVIYIGDWAGYSSAPVACTRGHREGPHNPPPVAFPSYYPIQRASRNALAYTPCSVAWSSGGSILDGSLTVFLKRDSRPLYKVGAYFFRIRLGPLIVELKRLWSATNCKTWNGHVRLP